MSNAFNSINDFVSAFLADTSVDPDVFDEWKERENSFKELINKFIPKVKKVKKTKKNKNAPKNPRSAYILFSNVERENVKNENPKMTSKEIMKELGKKWKEADDDEKEKYRELAKEDKERFDEEMKNYVPVEEEDTRDKKKKKRKAKNSPKNASGPYIFFCKEEREKIKKELPELKSQEIIKELGQRWKLIKDTDKVKKYQEMAEVDKERFKEEMKNYVPSEEDNEPKQKKPRAKKDKNAPKNPTTMYQLFCKDNRENLKKEGLNTKEITKKLSEMWKNFNKEDKKNKKKVEKWNTAIEKDKKRFEKEMEEYKIKKEQESEESDSDESHIMDDKEEEDDNEEESIDNIVKSIIDNHGDNVTKKVIKEELKKKGIDLSKDELNSVIQRVNV
jgi:hypothetical protein